MSHFYCDSLPPSMKLKVWHLSPNQCAFQVSLHRGPSSQSGLFPITSPVLLPQHRAVSLFQQVYLWISPWFIPFPSPPWATQSRPLSQGIFLLGLLLSATTQLTWHCRTAQCEFCLPCTSKPNTLVQDSITKHPPILLHYSLPLLEHSHVPTFQHLDCSFPYFFSQMKTS